MAIRTILVAVSGGSATEGAVELGCRLARRFDAYLEGFHVRTDIRDVLIAAGDGFGMPMSGELIDRITEDAAANAVKAKGLFDAALVRHELAVATAARPGASAAWREETGYGPTLVANRARFFDLVVLGRSERVVNEPHSDAVEQTLLYSGRPLLLAPAEPSPVIGETIAVGWNGSPEAVRAVNGSLRLLEAARKVSVVTVGEKHAASGVALVEYLAWHGIKAKLSNILNVSGLGPGQQLLSAARDADADLLVMGAFGQRPWRETLFGGATHEIVGVSLLPLLLSH